VPRMNGSTSLCIRLVEDRRDSDADGIVVQPGDVGDEEQEAETSEDPSASSSMSESAAVTKVLLRCQTQTCP